MIKGLTDESKTALKRLLTGNGRVSESNSRVALPYFEQTEEVDKLLEAVRKGGFCKALIRKGRVLGVTVAENSVFDTEHFGFGISKLKKLTVDENLPPAYALRARDMLLKECVSWMNKASLKCMISRVCYDDILDIIAHEKKGFVLADVLLTFRSSTSSTCVQNRQLDANVRPMQIGDETALMDIARCSFTTDHFHRDSHFPRQKCDELYSKWVYNCCRGLADEVLVATVKNKPVGFITCKIIESENVKEGIIDLVAVSSAFRRRGIGDSLVRESVRWFTEHDATSVSVGTQTNNLGAVRAYEKNGFQLVSTDLTFHRWLEDENE